MTDIFEAHGQVYVRCCATCKHWREPSDEKDFLAGPGNCYKHRIYEDANHWKPFKTLDLALCSKWQQKDDE